MHKLGRRVEDCHAKALTLVCEDCGAKTTIPARCMLRSCPMCNSLRAAKFRMKYMAMIKTFIADGNCTKGWSWKFILLTLAKSGSLENDMDRIASCFRRWWRKEFRTVKGVAGIAAIEIGKDSNVHVHVLAYVPYTDVYESSQHWKDITGDSVVLRIRPFVGPLERGINYVLKYILKGVETANPPQMVEYLLAARAKRCLITKGLFYRCDWKVTVYQQCLCCGHEMTWKPTHKPEIPSDVWTDGKFEWVCEPIRGPAF